MTPTRTLTTSRRHGSGSRTIRNMALNPKLVGTLRGVRGSGVGDHASSFRPYHFLIMGMNWALEYHTLTLFLLMEPL